MSSSLRADLHLLRGIAIAIDDGAVGLPVLRRTMPTRSTNSSPAIACGSSNSSSSGRSRSRKYSHHPALSSRRCQSSRYASSHRACCSSFRSVALSGTPSSSCARSAVDPLLALVDVLRRLAFLRLQAAARPCPLASRSAPQPLEPVAQAQRRHAVVLVVALDRCADLRRRSASGSSSSSACSMRAQAPARVEQRRRRASNP